jgi:hypothetical protein
MNRLALAALVLALPVAAFADDSITNASAPAIMARVLANRPAKDVSLKARLVVSEDQTVPVEILVKNLPGEVRTIYQSGQTRLLVVQPDQGDPRFYLRGSGELKGAARMGNFLGSHFSYYDLGLPFLRWPDPKLAGADRVRGRDCVVIEVQAANEPYARVKLWIDNEYLALLRAEAYDEKQQLVKRMAIASFKRIGDAWIPRGIDIAFVPKAQALPSEEKSRLEIYEGNYDARLAPEQFAPEAFLKGPAWTP